MHACTHARALTLCINYIFHGYNDVKTESLVQKSLKICHRKKKTQNRSLVLKIFCLIFGLTMMMMTTSTKKSYANENDKMQAPESDPDDLNCLKSLVGDFLGK